MSNDRGLLYCSWWTVPTDDSRKEFVRGLGRKLQEVGFEKSFFGGTFTRDGVTVEIKQNKIKGRKKTDVRVYAVPTESPNGLSSLRQAISGEIASYDVRVEREFEGDYWEKRA